MRGGPLRAGRWGAGEGPEGRPASTRIKPVGNWNFIPSVPDRAKTALIMLAVALLLQAGLATAEDGVAALTGRRPPGRAFSLARPAPGQYSVSLFGRDYRWSERLTLLEFIAGPSERPGLALFVPGRAPDAPDAAEAPRFITGRLSLGSVEAWRDAFAALLEALRRLFQGGPRVDEPSPAPSPGLARLSGHGV